tara:strand:- start:6007 stop:6225 length:219 start_codon:yes stop_codon:yes gene_type:complete
VSVELLPLDEYKDTLNLMPGNMVVVHGRAGTCGFIEYCKNGGALVKELKEGEVIKVHLANVWVVVEVIKSKI